MTIVFVFVFAAIFSANQVLDPVGDFIACINFTLRRAKDLILQLFAVLSHLVQILHQLNIAREDLWLEALTFHQVLQVLARNILEQILCLFYTLSVVVFAKFY